MLPFLLETPKSESNLLKSKLNPGTQQRYIGVTYPLHSSNHKKA